MLFGSRRASRADARLRRSPSIALIAIALPFFSGAEKEMHIRRALENEAEVLSALAFKSKAHWPYSASQLDAWRDALAVSAAEISSRPTCVAEVEARPAGFFMLLPASSDCWQLEHFWVAPASMGRGVGRALLAHALGMAADAGAQTLAIDADPNAEPFYLACGALRVGTVAAPIEGAPSRKRPQLLLSIKQPTGPPPALHKTQTA